MEVLKPTWQGHENLERIFIFGDSYSSVFDMITMENAPNPTADLPLGVPFPGDTWTDGEKPNWVGYLLKTWPFEQPLLIHDFAIGGDTVPRMEVIINGPYQDLVGRRCKCNEHWKPANSLFVFWIGINDLAHLSNEQSIKGRLTHLFSCVQTAYNTGARAFLFVDLPPIDRAPLIVTNETSRRDFASRYKMWNENLNKMVQQFSEEHLDASCFEYSSFKLLNSILDDPAEYGFDEGDAQKFGGGIWADHIHLTSAVHEWIARDIREYLMTV
ncbi:unnamed protein product [Rhizoctonia solani]|uniref:Uncharacterized protein n=3 Tax=Rhizoctonia solani TaxID=456999 RepID=A0A8H2XZV2_9AGAM|nr:cellulose-binding GDSL lipase acylhydrolase [Rhizoctonia solani AG-3 Rhs1AP]KEP55817.1 cellulose-binding GDSL lipase acylhydrolase [Rhizoctonia solani 123E]CAE6436999.1 unnamed protein product [Rhizoctonia solani]CAE6506750.1 unnamed protein product [Rhizoctonia solani]